MLAVGTGEPFPGFAVSEAAAAERPVGTRRLSIVEVSGDPWFFKLTGPEKTVHAARPDFESLANSVRPR